MRSSRIKAFNARSGGSISSSTVTNISSNKQMIILRMDISKKFILGGRFILPASVFSNFTLGNNYRIRIRTDKISEQFTDGIVVTAKKSNDAGMINLNIKPTTIDVNDECITNCIDIANQIEYAATKLNDEKGGEYSDITKVSEETGIGGGYKIKNYIINTFNLYDNTGSYNLLLEYPP